MKVAEKCTALVIRPAKGNYRLFSRLAALHIIVKKTTRYLTASCSLPQLIGTASGTISAKIKQNQVPVQNQP